LREEPQLQVNQVGGGMGLLQLLRETDGLFLMSWDTLVSFYPIQETEFMESNSDNTGFLVSSQDQELCVPLEHWICFMVLWRL
jgi:hypothetical protein